MSRFMSAESWLPPPASSSMHRGMFGFLKLFM